MSKNRSLALSVSDAAMGELIRQLDNMAAWYGTRVIIADRWFASSKTCSNCAQVKEALSLSERTFACPCGYVAWRDENAAFNLARWTPSPSPLLSAVALCPS
jgi:putative transposase